MPAPEADNPLDLLTILGRHANTRPDSPCLLIEDDVITFSELSARSERVAGAMRAQGIGAGDRVAILAYSSPILVELLLGCAIAGTI